MGNRELGSNELPLSDCLYLYNRESPYVDLELAQRLVPTRFEYTHISEKLMTDEMKKCKPIRFVVQGKKFSNQVYFVLGDWQMLGNQSKLSVDLTERNPEKVGFDEVRVTAFPDPEAKYVALYRIKFLSENETDGNKE